MPGGGTRIQAVKAAVSVDWGREAERKREETVLKAEIQISIHTHLSYLIHFGGGSPCGMISKLADGFHAGLGGSQNRKDRLSASGIFTESAHNRNARPPDLSV